jgi:2-hydroxychromene-2-carboxylate isomerase
VFGVPTFVHGDLRVWGQDRLAILEDGLRGRGLVPAAPPPEPRWTRPGPPPSVRFFHDFASPFSYLASTQIERVCAAAGATLEVVPILLGALFRSIGTADVPLFTMHPAKQAWVRRDLDDWAAHWGVGLAFPSEFPIRSVLPLRVALLEPAATVAIYRAAWVDDLPIADPEVLAGVLARTGLPAADLIARADDAAVKAALRRNTEDAVALGVCGVPSFVVRRAGRPDAVLWGQDRLPLLAATLAGFDLPA